MTSEELEQLVKTLDTDCCKVLLRKGLDYATDDILHNFKRMALIGRTILRIDLTPEKMALLLTCLKMDRLGNLLDRDPTNETKSDTVIDLINYIKLYWALENEEK